MNRIERQDAFYHDETGERFRQLFQNAEEKRERRHLVWRIIGLLVLALLSPFWWEAARSLSQ